MYTPDPQDKLDFENLDIRLYLALREIMKDYVGICEDAGGRDIEGTAAYKNNMHLLYTFEQSYGPIPDWAVGRNFGYELVPGAQLCTKDGRRTGNAHIVKTTALMYGLVGESLVYECLTDAGSKFTFTEVELLEAFRIGDWISDPERVIRDFDRNGEFRDEQ